MHFVKSTIPKEVVNEICILFIKKFERKKENVLRQSRFVVDVGDFI